MPNFWEKHIDKFAKAESDKKLPSRQLRELNSLYSDLKKVKEKLQEFFKKPPVARKDIEDEIKAIQDAMADILKRGNVKRIESNGIIYSIRKVPTYFKIISERTAIASLRKKKLRKFIQIEEHLDISSLKRYLLENKISLPGLKRMDGDASIYVYEKHGEDTELVEILSCVDSGNLEFNEENEKLQIEIDELRELNEKLEARVSESDNKEIVIENVVSEDHSDAIFDILEKVETFSPGIDEDLQHPEERWRELLASLRYIGNSAYPRLTEGKKWGDWNLDKALKYFGKIIDILRSKCFFPIIPPESGEAEHDSSYWNCYRDSVEKEYIKTEAPDDKEAQEWDKKRKDIIRAEEEIEDDDDIEELENFEDEIDEFADRVTTKFLRTNPDCTFVFGDNLIRKGKGGAAGLRDEANTFGFITKKLPNNLDSSFYRLKEYQPIFDRELKKLINEIERNPKRTFLISRIGAQLANKYHIREEIIEPGITKLSSYKNVVFLGEGGKLPETMKVAAKAIASTEKVKTMAIVGSRDTTPNMLKAAQLQTRKALDAGWNIVTGGAKGIDEEAIREVLKHEKDAKRLTVYLPKTIANQPTSVRPLLEKAKRLGANIVENEGFTRAIKETGKSVTDISYGQAAFIRNKSIVDAADAMVAIPKTTASRGTMHSINIATQKGIAVKQIDAKGNTLLLKKIAGKLQIKSLGNMTKILGKVLGKTLPLLVPIWTAIDLKKLWDDLEDLEKDVKEGKTNEDQVKLWNYLQTLKASEDEYVEILEGLSDENYEEDKGLEWHLIPKNQRLGGIEETIEDLEPRKLDPFPGEVVKKIKELAEEGKNYEEIDKVICDLIKDGELPTWLMYMSDSEKYSIFSKQDLSSLLLVEPHAELIWTEAKPAIVKSKKFTAHINEPLYLISGHKCWGIIKLSEPVEIKDQEKFDKLYSEHLVENMERKEWWGEKYPLWFYRIELVKKYDEPKEVEIPQGVQIFILPESITWR